MQFLQDLLQHHFLIAFLTPAGRPRHHFRARYVLVPQGCEPIDSGKFHHGLCDHGHQRTRRSNATPSPRSIPIVLQTSTPNFLHKLGRGTLLRTSSL